MAYDNDKLNLVVGNGPTGPRIWIYGPQSADAVATVRGAGFISNAKDRGMRVNDVVITVDTNTPLTSLSRVSVVASTGATLTA